MKQTDETFGAGETKPKPAIENGNSGKQFGISALFWLTFMIGLGVAYLQKQDSPDILVGGLVSVLIGLVVGAAVGWLSGRFGEAIFWATLIAAFACIATAGDPVGNWEHRLSWSIVGAVTGAVGAVFCPNRIALNALACAVSAGIVIFVFWIVAPRQTADMQFNLYAAPVIGVAVALFLRTLVWLESKRKMPRYITATWLLVAVIIGSALSR